MIIYFLDEDPLRAAQMVCDQHIPGQIKRCLTLLSTAHYLFGSENEKHFKPAFRKHPISLWTMQFIEHYEWIRKYMNGLFGEYRKVHGRESQYLSLSPEFVSTPMGLRYQKNYTAQPPTDSYLSEWYRIVSEQSKSSWIVRTINERVYYELVVCKDMKPKWSGARTKPEWFKKHEKKETVDEV